MGVPKLIENIEQLKYDFFFNNKKISTVMYEQ